jgi:hypothetical protein
VRRYLPRLIELIESQRIDPGKVFDLTLPLEQVAEGYRAMDERRAIKTLLRSLRSLWQHLLMLRSPSRETRPTASASGPRCALRTICTMFVAGATL